jgi:hypothetical protein
MSQVLPSMLLAQMRTATAPSSADSIANARYHVDDTVEDIPCKLVIPYGRRQDKF